MGTTADSFTIGGNLSVGGTITAAGDIVGGGGNRQTFLFSQADATASQSAVALAVHAGDSAITAVPMPRAGSIVGIAVRSEGARTAGTLTVDATIGGTVTGLQAVLNGTNTQTHYATQAKDTDTFTAGGLIGVKVTTDGDWAAGSTPSIVVAVEVES